AAALVGMDATDQEGIDRRLVGLDGSPSLQRLGANAVLAASLAVARAAATHQGQPLYRYLSQLGGGTRMTLPMPMTTILSGGTHVARAMDFQDFCVKPIGATSYSQALAMIWRVRNAAAELMKQRDLSVLLA